MADQRDDLALLIEGRDQLVQRGIILEGQQRATATGDPNSVVVIDRDSADRQCVFQHRHELRMMHETEADEIVRVGASGRAGIAMGVEHHLTALRRGEIDLMPGFGKHQEGARHLLGEEADWKALELGRVGNDRQDAT